jgi:hypothetical protein
MLIASHQSCYNSQEQKLLQAEFHTISFKDVYQHTKHFKLCTQFYTAQFCHVNSLFFNGKTLQIKGYTLNFSHAKWNSI